MPKVPAREEWEKRREETQKNNAEKWKAAKQALEKEIANLRDILSTEDFTQPVPIVALPETIRSAVVRAIYELPFMDDRMFIPRDERAELNCLLERERTLSEQINFLEAELAKTRAQIDKQNINPGGIARKKKKEDHLSNPIMIDFLTKYQIASSPYRRGEIRNEVKKLTGTNTDRTFYYYLKRFTEKADISENSS